MKEDLDSFQVSDRISFAKFLDLLRQDFETNSSTWENKTIPDLLEAMSRYAEDIQGYYDNMNQDIDANKPEWSTFADIFKGAKIYE